MPTIYKFSKGKPALADALVLMCPNAPFESAENPVTGEYDYEHVKWQTKEGWTPPTKEQVMYYLEKIQHEWEEKVQYKLTRKELYPSVGDQLDALWHAMDDGLIPKIEPMYSDIKSIKEEIPKGYHEEEFIINSFKQPEMNPDISPPEIVKPYNPDEIE